MNMYVKSVATNLNSLFLEKRSPNALHAERKSQRKRCQALVSQWVINLNLLLPALAQGVQAVVHQTVLHAVRLYVALVKT